MSDGSRWARPWSRAGAAVIAATVVTAVTTLLGFGVVAQLLGTVRVDGNEITSNALVESPNDALEIGEVNPLYEYRCNYDVVGYDRGPLPGLRLEVDANDGPGQSVTREFCIFNPQGPEQAVTIRPVINADVEVGACEASEVAAGDTTCAAGAAGELVAATELHLTATCAAGSELGTHEATFALGSSSVLDVGAVQELQTCLVTATVRVDGDPDLWQTDRARFDLLVEGTPLGG